MSRKIKFRSWDKILKIMSYNPVNAINFNGQFLLNDGKFHDINKTDYILMQYTGVVDKNGKEIYEGDIVKIMQKTETFFDKVIYDNHLCSFRFEGLSDYCDFCDWLREGAEFEVVGNIYENPELIGGEND